MALPTHDAVSRGRRLVVTLVVLVVLVGATVAVVLFGSPLSWLNSLAFPDNLEPTAGGTAFTPARLFDTPAWKSLESHGQLPVVVGATGRANPFLPTGSDLATAEGRDGARVRDMITLASTLAKYRQAEGRYPTGQLLTLGLPETTCLSDAGWVGASVCAPPHVTYLTTVPRDPGNGQYLYTGGQSFYRISMRLETASGKVASWDYSVGK